MSNNIDMAINSCNKSCPNHIELFKYDSNNLFDILEKIMIEIKKISPKSRTYIIKYMNKQISIGAMSSAGSYKPFYYPDQNTYDIDKIINDSIDELNNYMERLFGKMKEQCPNIFGCFIYYAAKKPNEIEIGLSGGKKDIYFMIKQ